MKALANVRRCFFDTRPLSTPIYGGIHIDFYPHLRLFTLVFAPPPPPTRGFFVFKGDFACACRMRTTAYAPHRNRKKSTAFDGRILPYAHRGMRQQSRFSIQKNARLTFSDVFCFRYISAPVFSVFTTSKRQILACPVLTLQRGQE